MKKTVFALLATLSPIVYSQSVISLSCVGSSDSKFQSIIKFNPVTKRIVDPLPIDYDLNVTDDLISFKRKVDKDSNYTTIVYRNTGQYTLFGDVKGAQYVWSGTCSKITQNKF